MISGTLEYLQVWKVDIALKKYFKLLLELFVWPFLKHSISKSYVFHFKGMELFAENLDKVRP